jgi:aryl-alcohol dehydrogenase-like predicted oxidoreductase
LGIGFVPWGSLGEGYLTGKIDVRSRFDPANDKRADFPRWSPENLQANKPFVDLLTRGAEVKNATPAQLALAWLLAQRPFIVPIPGTRNVVHLDENLGALTVELTPAEVQQLNAESAALTVHGERLDAGNMALVE